MPFNEYKNLDLPSITRSINDYWRANSTFLQSVKDRANCHNYIFYEGPPSANGLPGIHHVMARAIKDTVCRYRAQRGYRVDRKAGWDTHGLPVELAVEKKLGITKEEIGKSITVEKYNAECRAEVMRYTAEWRELTERMGYWVDLDNPYITYDTKYIETLWYLLSRLYQGGHLYQGKSIQPYSPAAGTGLSTHELNQPGCYRDIVDTTATVLFPILDDDYKSVQLMGVPLYLAAWTTTPWTLPSNTALAVAPAIPYARVLTINPYTGLPIALIMAEATLTAYFKSENQVNDPHAILSHEPTTPKSKPNQLPWMIIDRIAGSELEGHHYMPPFPWICLTGKIHRVITASFVTTEDGTGIVHIAPTFGADDAAAAREKGILAMTVKVRDGHLEPLVDLQGRLQTIEALDPDFAQKHVDLKAYAPWAGRFVRPEFEDRNGDSKPEDLNIDLCVDLKLRGLAFRIEKYTHSYPHCWRTDKPVLYYPLDAWFIRTTAFKDRMLELNRTIGWHPTSTGTGRFGQWLENLVDWNLSRSRFWGTPIPIWRTEDGKEALCIGSLQQLHDEITNAIDAGFMENNPLGDFVPGDYSKENYDKVDLHRPYVDRIILCSPSGKPMLRIPDLADVWFDSGAMPYAQIHYPFECSEAEFQTRFPADFIAEGVDQTRGWFFTLHAIATMTSNSVAFKNIISNGLVLDKNGNKMSKRLRNGVDPHGIIDSHGADPLRWYLLTNSNPWDNLRFDEAGVREVTRKFFATLHNSYSFFALYANVDGWTPNGDKQTVPIQNRTELDRWILSRLNSLKDYCVLALDEYDITRAARAMQEFADLELSNWYVRLNRKRFWAGDMDSDKLAAYQTLYECLITLARLIAPIAPFYAEQLFLDLTIQDNTPERSVHRTDYPTPNYDLIDAALERRMKLAQTVTSLALALRKKVNIRVRQPLSRIMIPVRDVQFQADLKAVEDILLQELNIKSIEYLQPENRVIVKVVKPNFRALGPRAGTKMKALAARIEALTDEEIARLEENAKIDLSLDGETFTITEQEVDIVPQDIPGWLVASNGSITIALDIQLSQELLDEGLARECVNRIQNLRRDSGFEVTDRIEMAIHANPDALRAIQTNCTYITDQVLAASMTLKAPEDPDRWFTAPIELDEPYGTISVNIRRL